MKNDQIYSQLLQDLKDTGTFADISSEEKFLKLNKNDGVYAGFDPTAPSLHLGNYIQIAVLKKLQSFGFHPIAVVGGMTGMIGDPSGRADERTLLEKKQLEDNKHSIKLQLESFGLKVVDNLSFYKNLTIAEFLIKIGKHININYMINKQIVKDRLKTNGISFTEFTYQLIQGWDFKELYSKHNIKLQIGGSDQWGNITTGLEFIRKTLMVDDAVGMTTSLLTTSDGKKYGKSAGNAIWLNPKMTTPFEMYQFFINTPDEDVEKLLYRITDLDILQVKSIMDEHRKEPHLRISQKQLAYHAVSEIHSIDIAKESIRLSDILFKSWDFSLLEKEDIMKLKGAIPTSSSKHPINIVELLVEIGAASSRRDARELIDDNAIELDGNKIVDVGFIVSTKDKEATLIKKGKKKYFLVLH